MKHPFSAHLGYLFQEIPIADRYAAAASTSFAKVEHPAPYVLQASVLRDLLHRHELTFVQLALPSGNAARGEKGFACLADRQQEFDHALPIGLSYAEEIGCRFVHMMSGVANPRLERARMYETYCGNLRKTARAARERGMTVLIEPVGAATIADYFLNDPFDAAGVIEDVGESNIALLFDVFHAENAGIDSVEFIERFAAIIAHVHIADHPGRHEPGTGLIDFARVFGALERHGYAGSIGLEYIPAGETKPGLVWMDTFR